MESGQSKDLTILIAIVYLNGAYPALPAEHDSTDVQYEDNSDGTTISCQ